MPCRPVVTKARLANFPLQRLRSKTIRLPTGGRHNALISVFWPICIGCVLRESEMRVASRREVAPPNEMAILGDARLTPPMPRTIAKTRLSSVVPENPHSAAHPAHCSRHGLRPIHPAFHTDHPDRWRTCAWSVKSLLTACRRLFTDFDRRGFGARSLHLVAHVRCYRARDVLHVVKIERHAHQERSRASETRMSCLVP